MWFLQCEVLSQRIIAVPSVALALTAPIQPLQQMIELVQAGIVAVHAVVVVITTELGIQPPKLFLYPQMAMLLTPFGYAFDRATKLLPCGAPLQTCLSFAVGTPPKFETQKVKTGFPQTVATER